MAHRFEDLRRRLESGEANVAGCLSGTSADGIDVVIARFEQGPTRSPTVLAFETLPFEPELGGRLRRVLDGEAPDLGGVARLARDLGRAFGEAVRSLAESSGQRVDLVGSHGQTVWHHDGRIEMRSEGRRVGGRASLQLGDGAEVAWAVRAPAVTDFRQADLAAGGEGAPLSALTDEQLFAHVARPLAILNLGGMANLTWLGASGEPGVAFDTGPAGSLLDGLSRRLLRQPHDEGGRAAARGAYDEGLLLELSEHPFFQLAPPKSTGRDTFGEEWVAGVVRRAEASGILAEGPFHLLATAVELVAWSVARHVERFTPRIPRELVVSGGGIHNVALVAALKRRTGIRLSSSAEHGVNPDAREALLFAILAQRALLDVPSTAPWATGAAAGHVLGAIHPAPTIGCAAPQSGRT